MGRTKWDWARFDHLSWVIDHPSHGSCHLKEGEQSLRAKTYLAMESVNSLRISAPPWWPLCEGRDGKWEGRKEKCEFLARESVSSSPIVRIFGKGKCKFIANFSATMVTSLPSISLSLSLSLSLSPKVPHAQYRKRFRASYNTLIDLGLVSTQVCATHRPSFNYTIIIVHQKVLEEEKEIVREVALGE